MIRSYRLAILTLVMLSFYTSNLSAFAGDKHHNRGHGNRHNNGGIFNRGHGNGHNNGGHGGGHGNGHNNGGIFNRGHGNGHNNGGHGGGHGNGHNNGGHGSGH